MTDTLAPVVLFVYNRPWYTRQTIEALLKNELADESELYIYSDAARGSKDYAAVQEVRDYIYSVSGFKKISILERKKNWGLADSIIDGVTTVVNQHGKVIVLEDDLVTSPYFLKFMNDALDFYEDEEKVMHVSGWNYPIEAVDNSDVFLWRVMNCWGWATWSDSWLQYEKNVDKVINTFSNEDKEAFNLDGVEDFFSQVVANKEGKITSWAIFWYACIFKNQGLCLNPVKTLVENIGHDGSGVHCSGNINFIDKLSDLSAFNMEAQKIEESLFYVEEVKHKLKKSWVERVFRKLIWT